MFSKYQDKRRMSSRKSQNISRRGTLGPPKNRTVTWGTDYIRFVGDDFLEMFEVSIVHLKKDRPVSPKP